MSRWLDLLDKGDFNSKPHPSNHQKPSKSPFLKSKEEINCEIYKLKVQLVNLEVQPGITPEGAKWVTALDAFVRPDEKDQFFENGQLRPRYHQVTFACESGLVVTFHHDKKITFYKPSANEAQIAPESAI